MRLWEGEAHQTSRSSAMATKKKKGMKSSSKSKGY
jgi:hypothetical protein